MTKEDIRTRFTSLIERYKAFIKIANREDISEESIRVWINEMLMIFGWNVQNTNEVIQERALQFKYRERLADIDSPHTKPDYILLNGRNIKTFIDAKDISVNIITNRNVAFQIRSYGWSAEVPCAFVSNFEQFAIYDCRFIPKIDQDANYGVKFFTIDEYLDNFDILFDHLFRENIISGKLEELYSVNRIEGQNRLDESFMNVLSDFRVKLAREIVRNNYEFIRSDEARLNYYVQVIMDRIIFIRVCESRGIEQVRKLKYFLDQGFWDRFKSSCYMDFYSHYDGAMFERDRNFQDLVLENSIFHEFINKLYYPSPFKFDIIPVKVIAAIYEDFLSRKVEFRDDEVIESFKPEYIKTQGAVTTPKYLVDAICKYTINLNSINSVSDLLSVKIFDPTCGSGTFLISCFDILERKLIHLFIDNKVEDQYIDWFIINGEDVYLSIDAKRAMIVNCIHGMDFDETAIEVTKMSLALKIVDNNDLKVLDRVGVFGERILREIHKNIKLGNTLVEIDIEINAEEIDQIKPYDIKGFGFAEVFKQRGGFDYIIGNPPYVETKHYKSSSPKVHKYLSGKYEVFEGKADLAILFIERCIGLLNNTGKLGFIIQKRFFRTEYGTKIRKMLSENRYIDRIIDFKTVKLFPRRMTYVAIMILDKRGCDEIKYEYITKEPLDIQYLFENDEDYASWDSIETAEISTDYFDENPWLFESYQLIGLITRLKRLFGTLGQYPSLRIKDGVQALLKKAYHIKEYSIEGNIIYGKNGLGEDVEIELDMVKAVIYNDNFYCFKELRPHAYTIFPYEGDELKTPIPMSEIRARYPLAYRYLKNKEVLIKSEVNYYDDDEYWHIFTREHNHDTYYDNKIILPMTAVDTIATFVEHQGLYMDNANVWFIKINGASTRIMKAITAILNSTAFSVLAKAGANPQSGGYYKLNKQFLMPVPFPTANVIDNNFVIDILADLHDEIEEQQLLYLNTTENRKDIYRRILLQKWIELDNCVYELYGLTDAEIELVKSKGRTKDRIDLLS